MMSINHHIVDIEKFGNDGGSFVQRKFTLNLSYH